MRKHLPDETGELLAELVTETCDAEASPASIGTCDHPAGCDKKATSTGFIAGCRASLCEEHASLYSMLRDPEGDEVI